MLPEAKKGRMNRANFDNYAYCGWWISKALDECKNGNNAGYTNKTGAVLVGELNPWFIKEAAVSWQLYLTKCFLEENGATTNSNKLYKVLRGLRGQRKMMTGLKTIVKWNPVDKWQAQIIRLQIKKCNDRLVYLEKTFIPLICESSDLLYYLTYLEEEGVSLHDDLAAYFGENYFNKYIEEQLDSLSSYYEHVKDVIESMRDREDITLKIEEGRARVNRMIEEGRTNKKNFKEEQTKKRHDDAMALVNGLTSRAQKNVVNNKTLRSYKMYVCAAAYVAGSAKSKHFAGYLHGSGSNLGISQNPALAKLYRTEEDAKVDAEALVDKSLREVVYNVVPIYKPI